MQRAWPDDPRVTRRLARMLQQRGLMHYGNGDVAAAINVAQPTAVPSFQPEYLLIGVDPL